MSRAYVTVILVASALVAVSCSTIDSLLFQEPPTPEPTPHFDDQTPAQPLISANPVPSGAVELVVCLDASNSVAVGDFQSTRNRLADAIEEIADESGPSNALSTWFLPMAPAPSIYVDPQVEGIIPALEAPPDVERLESETARLIREYSPDPIPAGVFDSLSDAAAMVKDYERRHEVVDSLFRDLAADIRSLPHGGEATFIGPCINRGALLLEGGSRIRTVLVVISDFVFAESIEPLPEGALTPEVWLVPTCGGPLDEDDSRDCELVMGAFEGSLAEAGFGHLRRVDITRLPVEFALLIGGS